MKVISTIDEMRAELKIAKGPVGLVPTMGALHIGHTSLVERAKTENATVVSTIFVNPKQFGPSEDFTRYPRPIEDDLAMLEKAGATIVFTPGTDTIYPPGFDTYVDCGKLTEKLEGKARPGHFRGVATVVTKLLSIVRPDRAYFGQKDAQQCMVIKKLNADLNLGVEIVICPTVREADGLALSSRNRYLNPEERAAAPVLYRSLRLAADLDTTDAEEVRRRMRALIEKEPLASIDYVSIADPATLEEMDRVDGKQALVSLAVRFGKTRLIDNIFIQR